MAVSGAVSVDQNEWESGFMAIAAEMILGSGYDPPAATELEIVVMEWLLKLLQLPKSFSFSSDGGGVMDGTTCESFVCTLVAAKEKKLSQIGNDKGDTLGKLVVYCYDQTHCSVQKASQIVYLQCKVLISKKFNDIYKLQRHFKFLNILLYTHNIRKP
ncbi:hypothetical protein L6452_23975 [Arctium lappa]|uniref:Uncharacterized protein n=1 Tax=Arctium lappa TaxID=4217 RepID=A0ACB9A876_ARCLA|nr:hypothetical protein L6452_23975 [Arctium lappa]